MSSNYYIYTVSAPDASSLVMREGAVDVDAFEGRCYNVDDAPPWVREIGILYEAISDRVDLFSAGEDMFGRKPESISFASFDLDEYRFRFADGSTEIVSRNQLSPYHADIRFDAYLVEMEEIGCVESYLGECLAEYDEQELAPDEAEETLRRYIEQHEEDLEASYGCSHYLEPLYVLVKMMLAARDGYRIVCERS